MTRWAEEVSTPARPVVTYFVNLELRDIKQQNKLFFNQIPTSFSLNNEQVDRLIAAGRNMLKSNPEYLRLLADMESK